MPVRARAPPGTAPASTGLIDGCSLVTAEEVGEVLGASVAVGEVPGGGCSFDQEDPRAVSVSLVATPYDEGSGGMDGTRQGIEGVLDGAPAEPLDGAGDEAFVAVGTARGGETSRVGGAVLGEGRPAADVRGLTVDLLRPVGDRA